MIGPLRSFRTWHYARTHDPIDWQISWPEFGLPKAAHVALVSVASTNGEITTTTLTRATSEQLPQMEQLAR